MHKKHEQKIKATNLRGKRNKGPKPNWGKAKSGFVVKSVIDEETGTLPLETTFFGTKGDRGNKTENWLSQGCSGKS